jgi:hypothetical protein
MSTMKLGFKQHIAERDAISGPFLDIFGGVSTGASKRSPWHLAEDTIAQ